MVLFERDDAIAVPLLSQVRLGGFDVRAARTPVELFDILGKNSVSLVLVDLGNATAGRREFWVALDAQRRGRNLQVMTFRYTPLGSFIDPDFDPGGRVVADVEVRGTQEFQLIVDGLRQRIPAHGIADPAAASMAALNGTPTPFGMQGLPAFGGSPFAQPQMGYQQGFVVPSDPQQGLGYGRRTRMRPRRGRALPTVRRHSEARQASARRNGRRLRRPAPSRNRSRRTPSP